MTYNRSSCLMSMLSSKSVGSLITWMIVIPLCPSPVFLPSFSPTDYLYTGSIPFTQLPHPHLQSAANIFKNSFSAAALVAYISRLIPLSNLSCLLCASHIPFGLPVFHVPRSSRLWLSKFLSPLSVDMSYVRSLITHFCYNSQWSVLKSTIQSLFRSVMWLDKQTNIPIPRKRNYNSSKLSVTRLFDSRYITYQCLKSVCYSVITSVPSVPLKLLKVFKTCLSHSPNKPLGLLVLICSTEPTAYDTVTQIDENEYWSFNSCINSTSFPVSGHTDALNQAHRSNFFIFTGL